MILNVFESINLRGNAKFGSELFRNEDEKTTGFVNEYFGIDMNYANFDESYFKAQSSEYSIPVPMDKILVELTQSGIELNETSEQLFNYFQKAILDQSLSREDTENKAVTLNNLNQKYIIFKLHYEDTTSAITGETLQTVWRMMNYGFNSKVFEKSPEGQEESKEASSNSGRIVGMIVKNTESAYRTILEIEGKWRTFTTSIESVGDMEEIFNSNEDEGYFPIVLIYKLMTKEEFDRESSEINNSMKKAIIEQNDSSDDEAQKSPEEERKLAPAPSQGNSDLSYHTANDGDESNQGMGSGWLASSSQSLN